MIFVSIIFHLKSILAKNYLMSHLLDTKFNFLLNYELLFLQQHAGLSTSKYNNLYLSMSEESPKRVDPHDHIVKQNRPRREHFLLLGYPHKTAVIKIKKRKKP
jgi:hypothetical protein